MNIKGSSECRFMVMVKIHHHHHHRHLILSHKFNLTHLHLHLFIFCHFPSSGKCSSEKNLISLIKSLAFSVFAILNIQKHYFIFIIFTFLIFPISNLHFPLSIHCELFILAHHINNYISLSH